MGIGFGGRPRGRVLTFNIPEKEFGMRGRILTFEIPDLEERSSSLHSRVGDCISTYNISEKEHIIRAAL